LSALNKACASKKVARFIHISALGCDISKSKYGKSKLAGEYAIAENYKGATILRPSVVFGVEDGFFNLFARMATILPALPLIGGGVTRFQPVYVGDVADAVIAACAQGSAIGQTYEIGGPEIFTFRQLFEKIKTFTGRKPMLISLPWGIAKMQGCLLSILPKPPLTVDQVESLKTDNVVSQGAKSLTDLGVTPTAADVILPTYLARYRPGGRFGDKKRA
jgi:NADH dehydrogenase